MNNFTCSISTMYTEGGNALRSVEPVDGVYKNIPVAILGLASRGKSVYGTTSFLSSMTDPRTKFYNALCEGHLEGEWGHPDLTLFNNRQAATRTMHIDRTLVSHYFTKVYTKEAPDGSYLIVYADVVPYGPYGQYLTDSFKDSKRNTAFSLRSLTSSAKRLPNGNVLKEVAMLSTFDAVDAPGFKEACKRYQIANEEFNVAYEDKDFATITIQDIVQNDDFLKAVGFESINHQALLDVLEVDKVIIEKDVTTHGVYDEDKNLIITPSGNVSLFHSLYK